MKIGLVVIVCLLLLGVSIKEQLPRGHEIGNGSKACSKSKLVEPDYTLEELGVPRISAGISALWILEKIGVNLDGVGWSERIGRFRRRSHPYRRKGLRRVQIRRLENRIRRLTSVLEAEQSEVARWG